MILINLRYAIILLILQRERMKKLCGIDEAGRGPIAGDLVMAGCILTGKVDGLNDSKKLTEKKREALYELIVKNSIYHIAKFSPKQIDDGIFFSLHNFFYY